MSNYCKSCSYKVKEKNGPQACPFNYLYWNFLDHNKSKLSNNPRLGMPYKTLSKMPDEKIKLIRNDSKTFLKALETNQYI
jgi:deoxyribodipyrimidine photolyase-related protein